MYKVQNDFYTNLSEITPIDSSFFYLISFLISILKNQLSS